MASRRSVLYTRLSNSQHKQPDTHVYRYTPTYTPFGNIPGSSCSASQPYIGYSYLCLVSRLKRGERYTCSTFGLNTTLLLCLAVVVFKQTALMYVCMYVCLSCKYVVIFFFFFFHNSPYVYAYECVSGLAVNT